MRAYVIPSFKIFGEDINENISLYFLFDDSSHLIN